MNAPKRRKRPARVEPDVCFPVCWPADAEPPTIAAWLLRGMKMHIRYAQAVAEIARRNGGGGFLRVETKPDRWDHEDGGARYTGALAVMCWDRGALELSADTQRPDELRAGPTQTRFTAQVVVPNGTDKPDKATALVNCHTFHAHALRKLEEGGFNANIGVVLAMDGGGAA